MDVHLYDPQLIDPDLWGEAGWYGLGYLFDRTRQEPPRVGPLFRDAALGRRIFEAWKRRLGGSDRHEALRFVLVAGRAPEAATARYSVLLSTDPEGVARLAEEEGHEDVGYVVTRTRVCHLPGPPSAFLLTLHRDAARHTPYLLTPFTEGTGHRLDPMAELGILKHHLEVRSADDIAPDEPDAAVFQ